MVWTTPSCHRCSFASHSLCLGSGWDIPAAMEKDGEIQKKYGALNRNISEQWVIFTMVTMEDQIPRYPEADRLSTGTKNRMTIMGPEKYDDTCWNATTWYIPKVNKTKALYIYTQYIYIYGVYIYIHGVYIYIWYKCTFHQKKCTGNYIDVAQAQFLLS